jgi:hypothetical protein
MFHNPSLQKAQSELDTARFELTLTIFAAERSGDDAAIRAAQERVRLARCRQDDKALRALQI